MAIKKLKHFQIICPERYFDETIKFAVSSGKISMLDYKSADISSELEYNFNHINLREKIEKLTILKKRLTNIAEILELDLDKEFFENQITVNFDAIYGYEKNISDIESEVLKINKKINLFANEIKKIEDLKHKLEFMISVNLQFNISVFNDFYFIEMIYGRMSKFNSLRFKEIFSNDSNSIYYELKTEENISYYLLIYLKSQKENIFKILNSLYFETLDIPANIMDKPKHIISKLNDDIQLLECELDKYKLEKKHKKILLGNIIKKMYNDLAANIILKEIEERSGRLGNAYLITGWLPEEFDGAFSYNLDKISCNSLIYSSQSAEDYYKKKDGKIKVPSLIENTKFFKPFESILEMYGAPSYFEYDPTRIVAVSFLIMFGLMFGDAGQG